MQRRPWLVAAGVSALLLVACALPFLQVNYGSGDPRILPRGAESRQVAQTLLADFPGKQASPIQVVARMVASDPRVAAYAAKMKDYPGVAAVSVEPGLRTRRQAGRSPRHAPKARAYATLRRRPPSCAQIPVISRSRA